MKKRYLIIVILLLLPINIFALENGYWTSGYLGYNYDVDELELDSNGDLVIGGWGIIEASPHRASEGPTTALMSGTKSSTLNKHAALPYACDGSNTYTFKLNVYEARGENKGSLLGTFNSSGAPEVSMTYALSHKHGSVIEWDSPSDTNYACYEDVGFRFVVDKSKIKGKKELIFELEVIASGGSLKYDITVVTVDGEDEDSRSVDYELISEDTIVTEVTNLMQNGYTWETPGYAFNGTKSSSYVVNNGNVVTVLDTARADNMVWYGVEVRGKKRWIPSSWVLPAGNASVFLMDPKEPETCENNNLKPSKSVESVNTCPGINEKQFGSKNDCITVSNNAYYTVNCEEKVTTKFLADIDSPLYAGEGFSVGAEVTSVRTCTGKFDKDSFMESWEIARDNYNGAKTREDKAVAAAIMNLLRNTVLDYNSFSDTNYTFDPTMKGTISYKTKNGNQSDTLKFERTIDPGSGSYTKKTTVHLNIDVPNPIDFEYSNSAHPKKAKFELAKAYLEPITGRMGTTGVGGFRMHYLSHYAQKGNYKIKLEVNDLGEYKTHSVKNENCEVNLLETELLYRIIDRGDPFIKTISGYTHQIGKNWFSSKRDFTKVAEQNLRSLYVIDLSGEDIKNIKNYQGSLSENLYLGGCKDSQIGGNDPVCAKLVS